MSALADLPPEPAPPTRYRVPPIGIAYLTSRIFTGLPRHTFEHDARWLLTGFPQPPQVHGAENLPAHGAVTVCANHYQRQGLWIGWPGAVIAVAMANVQPRPVPIHIIVTDSQRMRLLGREMTMPLSRWFLGRIAKAWGMIPIPADDRDTSGRAATLRTALRLLGAGEPILFFPEGERGRAGPLREALPGTGSFLRLAARRSAVIPCAIREAQGAVHVQFGPALRIDTESDTDSDRDHGQDASDRTDRDAQLRALVMRAIAAMLPPDMRGPFSG